MTRKEDIVERSDDYWLGYNIGSMMARQVVIPEDQWDDFLTVAIARNVQVRYVNTRHLRAGWKTGYRENRPPDEQISPTP